MLWIKVWGNAWSHVASPQVQPLNGENLLFRWLRAILPRVNHKKEMISARMKVLGSGGGMTSWGNVGVGERKGTLTQV
jgi:hypothetical protein